jgi:hypothetical protein
MLLRIARGQRAGDYVVDKASGLYHPLGLDMSAQFPFTL